LVNKDGQFKTRLPTQYRTKKSSKKVLKKEGEKHNYSIEKCVICNKKKMEKYDLINKETNSKITTIRKCKNCNYVNSSSVVWENNNNNNNTPITYYKPAGSLQDKS
jgi:hypothetical protein